MGATYFDDHGLERHEMFPLAPPHCTILYFTHLYLLLRFTIGTHHIVLHFIIWHCAGERVLIEPHWTKLEPITYFSYQIPIPLEIIASRWRLQVSFRCYLSKREVTRSILLRVRIVMQGERRIYWQLIS